MVQGDRPAGTATSDGFEGGVAGLDLPALVQLNAMNRFSGCFRVSHGARTGMIFFRDGEIVHAEEGARSGEEAFSEMVTWPGGRFSVEPNVVTARRTIHKSCNHLLLDAHRQMDERRSRDGGPAPSPPPIPSARPAPSPPAAASGPVDLVRTVAGVEDAVLLGKDGRAAGPVAYEAEVLAAHGAFLSAAAGELGALFDGGELRGASAQGARRSVLVLAAKNHLLAVAVRPDADLGAVEAAIRALLVPKR
jgi:predicted regulator of Ras-like GTPase activity (Roadblock/LC7/MglB family)